MLDVQRSLAGEKFYSRTTSDCGTYGESMLQRMVTEGWSLE